MEPLKKPNDIGKGFTTCQLCTCPSFELRTLSCVNKNKEDKLTKEEAFVCPACLDRLGFLFWTWREVFN